MRCRLVRGRRDSGRVGWAWTVWPPPTPERWKAAGILSETIGAGCRAEPRGDRVRLIMMGKAIPDPSATLRASGIPFSLPEAVDPTLEDVLSSLVREDPHG